jgi:hypothetical protein
MTSIVGRKYSKPTESCSRASSRSRAICPTDEPWLAADELRGRTVSVPLLRFGTAVLRGLTDPTLERCLMALPEAQEAHRSDSDWLAQGHLGCSYPSGTMSWQFSGRSHFSAARVLHGYAASNARAAAA